MPHSPAVLLHHQGHGPAHFDLICGYGSRCPTWRIAVDNGHWIVVSSVPHRRFYLNYSGPVAHQRGVVRQRWRGLAYWSRDHLSFGPWGFRRLVLRVVPYPRVPTLPRP